MWSTFRYTSLAPLKVFKSYDLSFQDETWMKLGMGLACLVKALRTRDQASEF